MFGADALDDCRICQCTWRGGRCARVDLCHPTCLPYLDRRDVMVADQARMPADNGLCVCDYGRMACDPRGCDPDCGVEQDACSGG